MEDKAIVRNCFFEPDEPIRRQETQSAEKFLVGKISLPFACNC